MSFISKLIQRDGGDIRIITSFENNKPAWFVIKINPAQYREYKNSLKSIKMNIRDYGQILDSGWEDLSDERITQLKKLYLSS